MKVEDDHDGSEIVDGDASDEDEDEAPTPIEAPQALVVFAASGLVACKPQKLFDFAFGNEDAPFQKKIAAAEVRTGRSRKDRGSRGEDAPAEVGLCSWGCVGGLYTWDWVGSMATPLEKQLSAAEMGLYVVGVFLAACRFMGV